MNVKLLLLEELATVKRPHTDKFPKVTINTKAILRNKIVKFIGDQNLQKATRDEIKEFIKNLESDKEIGKVFSDKWIYKNKHLVKRVIAGKEIFYKLTRAGLNTYKLLTAEKGS